MIARPYVTRDQMTLTVPTRIHFSERRRNLELTSLVELFMFKINIVQTAHKLFRHIGEGQVTSRIIASLCCIHTSEMEGITQLFLSQPLNHRKLLGRFLRRRVSALTLLFDIHKVKRPHSLLPLLCVRVALIFQPDPATQTHFQQLRRLREHPRRRTRRPVVPPVSLSTSVATEYFHVLSTHQVRRSVVDEHAPFLLVLDHAVDVAVADDAPGEEGTGGELQAVGA
mmetsp:Transcript_38382/g.80454  ORF Transcript_38382/g.80454 Transcript_38382/m.80454 type:complete len:226 (-) Transcript_38382:481-1158(-)